MQPSGECAAFKCADDCRCAHKSKSERQLEIIINEMLNMSGILPEQPEPEPNTEELERMLNISGILQEQPAPGPNTEELEPAIVENEIDEDPPTYNSGPDVTNSVWVPIVNNDATPRQQSLGNTFNEGISRFNDYVGKVRTNKPESPPAGAPYPCRLQFENIQDNIRQEKKQMKRLEKQRDFDKGVHRMTQEIEKWEANKPVVESPLRPPVYPCRFERENILWDERKERETQKNIEDQAQFDERAAAVNMEMIRLKPKISTPRSPPKPPIPVPVGTISRRQIREASEAKTREIFCNENLKERNTCWSKPFKPHVPQTPPNKPPQREIDTRGIIPPVKFSPLYSNIDNKMAAYYKNCEYFDNLKRDKLKDYFRTAYGRR